MLCDTTYDFKCFAKDGNSMEQTDYVKADLKVP